MPPQGPWIRCLPRGVVLVVVRPHVAHGGLDVHGAHDRVRRRLVAPLLVDLQPDLVKVARHAQVRACEAVLVLLKARGPMVRTNEIRFALRRMVRSRYFTDLGEKACQYFHG